MSPSTLTVTLLALPHPSPLLITSCFRRHRPTTAAGAALAPLLEAPGARRAAGRGAQPPPSNDAERKYDVATRELLFDRTGRATDR